MFRVSPILTLGSPSTTNTSARFPASRVPQSSACISSAALRVAVIVIVAVVIIAVVVSMPPELVSNVALFFAYFQTRT